MNQKVPAPTWFTVFAVVALLWNLVGVVAYLWMTWLMEVVMTPEALQALPDAQRAAVQAQLAMQAVTPAWATAAFALAVFGGLLGSLFLVLKKNLAIIFLTISLAGLIVQSYYAYVIAGAFDIYGMPAVVQSLGIALIAIGLLWMANTAKAKGWST